MYMFLYMRVCTMCEQKKITFSNTDYFTDNDEMFP